MACDPDDDVRVPVARQVPRRHAEPTGRQDGDIPMVCVLPAGLRPVGQDVHPPRPLRGRGRDELVDAVPGEARPRSR